MKTLSLVGAFSLGAYAAAVVAYLWVDRSLGRISW